MTKRSAKGLQALREFASELDTKPGNLECGLVYDSVVGWRVYQRYNEKALLLGPGQTRKWARTMLRKLKKQSPEHDLSALHETMNMLLELSDEAQSNNRNKVVPEGYADAMPVAGSA